MGTRVAVVAGFNGLRRQGYLAGVSATARTRTFRRNVPTTGRRRLPAWKPRTGDDYARALRHNYATTVWQPEAA